jgi:hypothetical protein
VLTDKAYLGISYKAIDPEKEKAVSDDAAKTAIAAAKKSGQFDALAKMAFFPSFMLACYVILHLYFKSTGGYKVQSLGGH